MVQYCTIHGAVQYDTAQHNIMWHGTIPHIQHSTVTPVDTTIVYGITRYDMVQCNTVQHDAIQYDTIWHGRIWHNTVEDTALYNAT